MPVLPMLQSSALPSVCSSASRSIGWSQGYFLADCKAHAVQAIMQAISNQSKTVIYTFSGILVVTGGGRYRANEGRC